MEEKKVNLETYLQVRNERKVAILLAVVFVVFYAIAAFALAIQMARYFTFVSVGNIMMMTIAVFILLPPITVVHQVEQQRPEWKKESSKGIPLSSQFVSRALVVFAGCALVLAVLFTQAGGHF